MRLDLYARTSTQHQDVDQQMHFLRQWCRKNEHEISFEVWDQESAKIDLQDRKKFIELLENPKGDGLLVLNLDRLTRNWDSVTFIEKHFRNNWNNYKLVSTADEINLENASGRAMFRMKLVMNCFMPEDMLEKQKIGIARAKAQGKFKGRPKGALGKNNKANVKLDITNNNKLTLQVQQLNKTGIER